MNIVFFTHPSFLASQSMPRFTAMLTKGMAERGHSVETWAPHPQFYNLPVISSLKKWMGYIDQYLIFPQQVKERLTICQKDTLFVFTDHALGPWVPLFANRPHVIHCHDFLAQRSAKDEIPENPTGWTGKQYQQYIRKGYQQGRNFISVSQQTKNDLHKFLKSPHRISEVVYNGMNQQIKTTDIHTARKQLGGLLKIDLTSGYILHVGGNQWYKNRKGVIEIYTTWRADDKHKLPLIMIGSSPSEVLQKARDLSSYKEDIYFISCLNDEAVQLAYSGASLFLYPSLAEGFGWPIAEAMSTGCPVVTTGEAPMNEVGGEAAVYISRRPANEGDVLGWAKQCANTIDKILSLDSKQRDKVVHAGFDNVQRFNTAAALDKIESIYQQVLANGN
ncbi:glycosyltransferase family 4 protein [Ilyomonas limi]|uniref:Glycosyltransferase family 4 protein n=1 Tax=Ilyomonas limi TaxID=2575867 RepID=A0A4U3KZV8_9BACT|nr:glycosyltransferase [Ilyomonas limi]TKK68208.1 glycosyltransferase family 4 protein [Ilyomonas limi]